MKSDPDLYSVLGVGPTASSDEIRSAFRAAAKANHPDRFASYIQRLVATRRMQDLNRAYSVLRDPARRRAYDATRPRTPPVPTPRPDGARADNPSTRRPASRRTAPDHEMWWTVAWLLASAVVGYFYAREFAPDSVLGYVAIAVVALFVTPMLFVVVIMTLAIPIFIVAHAFMASFEDRQGSTSAGVGRLVVDLAVRGILLTMITWLFVLAFQAGIQSDLLYLLLLAAAGSVAGELVAMLLYVVRRRKVVATTVALLRLEPEPAERFVYDAG